MRITFHANLLALFSLVLAGCSIRPIPDDVTRHSTYQITQRIRCEFREELSTLLIGALRSPDFSTPKNRLVAEDLHSGRLKFKPFFDSVLQKLDDPIRKTIQRYRAGAIGYDFDFDITQDDNKTASLGLTSPLTRGPLLVALTAKDDRARQNKRTFRVIDTFETLLVSPIMDRVCSDGKVEVAHKNERYPIDGKINLGEMLDSFISLVQSGNLVGTTGAPLVPTFADVITYTTTISGTLNPKLTLSTAGSALQLTGAELNALRQRKDIHKVTIALTLPSEGKPLTVAQRRGADEAAAAAAFELDRQRVIAIDADTTAIRRSLLQR